DPRAVLEQLPSPVGRGGDDAEAAGAGRDERLEGDVLVGVAELASRCRDCVCATHPAPLWPTNPDRVEQRVALGLVVRAANRVGGGDEDARVAEFTLRLGEGEELERRLWDHSVDVLAFADGGKGGGEARVASCRRHVEG